MHYLDVFDFPGGMAHPGHRASIARIVHQLAMSQVGRMVLDELLAVATRTGPRADKLLVEPTSGGMQTAAFQNWDQVGSTVYFSAAHWREPSSVFLHELVHVIDHFEGRPDWARHKVSGEFDEKGEVIGIAIANLYRLEQGQRTVRADHLSPEATKWVPPSDAVPVFAVHHDVFTEYAARKPRLCARLGHYEPPGYPAHLFNPFRAVAVDGPGRHQVMIHYNRSQADALFAPPA